MPLRPCVELGCPELVERGRCPEHARAHRARASVRKRTSIAKKIYDDPRWQKARQQAIDRAGGRCQALEHGRRCECTKGLHGHHDYPGGVEAMVLDGLNPFDVRYVVALCARHHGRVEASRGRNPSSGR